MRTNNDSGWKLVFGQRLPLQHDIRGKLATVCGAGEHVGESVLLMTSRVDRHIALPLQCDGGPSISVLIGEPNKNNLCDPLAIMNNSSFNVRPGVLIIIILL